MAARHRQEGEQWKALGDFIRSQRQLADLSLRQLSELAQVSNPYLSQIERGLHRPSAQILKSIAAALDLSAETVYAQAGFLEGEEPERTPAVEDAIRLDSKLTHEQKLALIQVYRGFAG
jgi:transcriptional regulator with XRE-family HTH domain